MAPAVKRLTLVRPGTLTADRGQEHGGSSKVSFEEFESWYKKSEMSVEAEMNKVFNKIDADNDGSITHEELETLCKEFHGAHTCLPPRVLVLACLRHLAQLELSRCSAPSLRAAAAPQRCAEAWRSDAVPDCLVVVVVIGAAVRCGAVQATRRSTRAKCKLPSN